MKRKLRNETIWAIEDACLRNSPICFANNWQSVPPAFTLKWTYGAGISRLFQRIVGYRDYFDYSLENDAVSFLKGRGMLIHKKYNSVHFLENKIINDNFIVTEIENAIDCSTCNKAPGVDHIPAEFIKHRKSILSDTITEVLNYVVENVTSPNVRLKVFVAQLINLQDAKCQKTIEALQFFLY